MKRLILFSILIITILVLGCQPKGICGSSSGKSDCRQGMWVFKTAPLNYSDYRFGSSINERGFWSVSYRTAETEISELNKDYLLMFSAPFYSPMSLYKKSFNESLYYPEDSEDKAESKRLYQKLTDEGLVIQQPFTELYICPPLDIVDPSDPKKSILEKDPNYIIDQLNKMIDEGTLTKTCSREFGLQ